MESTPNRNLFKQFEATNIYLTDISIHIFPVCRQPSHNIGTMLSKHSTRNVNWTLVKQISNICRYVRKISTEFVSKTFNLNGGVDRVAEGGVEAHMQG
jgi:hypothetical protein